MNVRQFLIFGVSVLTLCLCGPLLPRRRKAHTCA